MTCRPWLRSCLTLLGAGAPLSAQAHLEWLATHGAVPGQADRAVATAVDASGNVHAALVCEGTFGDSHIQVVKYASDGQVVWSRSLDPAPTYADEPVGIAVAANGDVCLGGTSLTIRREVFAARYDVAGQLLWTKSTTGAPEHSGARACDLALDAQGNLWIAGAVKTASGWLDGLVQVYGPTGALLADTRIDGPAGQHDVATAIEIAGNGSVFVAAEVEGAGSIAAGIAMLDAGGDLQWLRLLHAGPGHDEHLRGLASDGLGGVLAWGATSDSQGTGSLIARCDGEGTILWTQRQPLAPDVFGTIDALVDDQGITWSLHRLGVLAPSGAWLSRYSTTGAEISEEALPFFEAPVSLCADSASRVFALGRAASTPSGPPGPAVVALFESSGALAWTQSFFHGAEGLLPAGMHAAPQQRLVIHGALAEAPTGGLDAFVLQIDASESPYVYCTPKTNSLGCEPRIGFLGMPSASASQGFEVRVEQVAKHKPGLFLHGVHGAASIPFGGGTLCVQAPVRRTPGVDSGGIPGPSQQCSGVFAIDMNAFAHGSLGGSPIPELSVPGTRVWMQAWGRDNGFPAPNNIALSAGLTYVVLP